MLPRKESHFSFATFTPLSITTRGGIHRRNIAANTTINDRRTDAWPTYCAPSFLTIATCVLATPQETCFKHNQNLNLSLHQKYWLHSIMGGLCMGSRVFLYYIFLDTAWSLPTPTTAPQTDPPPFGVTPLAAAIRCYGHYKNLLQKYWVR